MKINKAKVKGLLKEFRMALILLGLAIALFVVKQYFFGVDARGETTDCFSEFIFAERIPDIHSYTAF